LPNEITDTNERVLLAKGTPLRRASGCAKCHNTGYRGRMGIFEVLELDDELRELVKGRATKRGYHEAVERVGLVPLREVGLVKAKKGRTSLEEVLRVT